MKEDEGEDEDGKNEVSSNTINGRFTSYVIYLVL